jgi:hypothetical protein
VRVVVPHQVSTYGYWICQKLAESAHMPVLSIEGFTQVSLITLQGRSPWET